MVRQKRDRPVDSNIELLEEGEEKIIKMVIDNEVSTLREHCHIHFIKSW